MYIYIYVYILKTPVFSVKDMGEKCWVCFVILLVIHHKVKKKERNTRNERLFVWLVLKGGVAMAEANHSQKESEKRELQNG